MKEYDVRICKNPKCKIPFTPKKVNQLFHEDACKKSYHGDLAKKLREEFRNSGRDEVELLKGK